MYAPNLSKLLGHTISEVWFSEEYLTFKLENDSLVSYTVEGDCCSWSYFYDFIGLEKLRNCPVVEFNAVKLLPSDPRAEVGDDEYTYTQVYGFEIVVVHHMYGEMTVVFSFRNDSNGYYGGWMINASGMIYEGQELLTQDKVGS